MKVTMNLLPAKYIGVKRDWRAIYIAIILTVFTLVVNGSFYALNWMKDRKVIFKEPDLGRYEQQIRDVARQIRQIQEKIKELPIPEKMIRDLKGRIDFINKFMGVQPLRWSAFFEKLESLAPEKIWIEKLETMPSDRVPEFSAQCKTEAHKEVNTFWSNLESSIDFQDVQLVDEKSFIEGEEEKKDSKKRQTQEREKEEPEKPKKKKKPIVYFELRFKYAPVVRLEVIPSTVRKVSGTSQQFAVQGENIVGEKVRVPSDWPSWSLTPEAIGVVKDTGLFFALKPGSGRVSVKSPDKKMETFADVYVQD